MTCPCDERIWPYPLSIAPGLRSIPRQQFDFVGMRRAMFDAMADHRALAAWVARERTDFGVMLLELWAYAGELLSIYDQAIANESYVRTAVLRPSLRALIDLLGYRPRPATAAIVEVAAIVEGARPITLPVGTAFRSGAFGAEPPQVFELVAPASIHPALDRWSIETPISRTIAGRFSQLLADPATSTIAGGEVVLVEIETSVYVRRVDKIARVVDDAGRRLAAIHLDREVEHGAAPIDLAGIRLHRPRRQAALKSPSAIGTDPPSFRATSARFDFVLDGVYSDARPSGLAVAQRAGDLRWFRIDQRADEWLQTSSSQRASFTVLHASSSLDAREGLASPVLASWSSISHDELVLHIGFEPAARLVGAAKRTLDVGDRLAIAARAPIGSLPSTSRVLLRDTEENGVAIDAGVDFAGNRVVPASDATWPSLATPLEAFGNVVSAVRGETVTRELVGLGDASQVHQAFALAKKPLTYVASAGAPSGVASSLRVWVNGLEWYEVPTLFGQGPLSEVFTVRLDDNDVARVTFGDGVRGARVPTGATIEASYRFGAGAAMPPAGSIQQIARPVIGLRSIVGPVAAAGGSDRESASALRTLAPRSAVLLGRAISIEDMEVAALGVPGVVTAAAEWTWDGRAQRPVVKVWVVGDTRAPAAVSSRLRAISDPSTPIRSAAATPIPLALSIDLEIDPRRIADDVLALVRESITGDGGVLAVPQLGIGRSLARSQLVAALLDVAGVTGVRGISWGGAPMAWAVDPGPGCYFDLGAGPTVTGS